MYLGYLGYKTANVPIVKGIEPPGELFRADPAKVVGLTIDASRLSEIRRDEPLWNDNKESWRSGFWGRESLLGYALRMHFDRRRRYPRELAAYPVVRLRSQVEVDRFVRGAGAT